MNLYKIRDVLSNIDHMPDTALYLPATPWSLDTEGAFSLDSRDFAPDSTAYLPPQVASDGWKASLDKASIEDVIFNADQQLANATLDDYFAAFEFYVQNDAFKAFE